MARKKNSKRPPNTGCLFKRREGGVWLARWFDHHGKRRERTTGTTDTAAAERILRKFLSDAAERKAGVVDSRLDRYVLNSRKPLLTHLADFIAGAKARDVTPQQAQQLETRVKRVLALARAEVIADLNPHAVQMAIADVRKGDKKHRPASVQTAAHYLRNTKQFTRWLKRDGRVASDPLADIESAGNPETDRKRVRRALADEELARLVRAAEVGPVVRKVPGVDRAMLYRTAIGTGFRASELKSLTPESFDLQAEPPTVTVDAAYSKHRQTDVQPIRPELAEVLKPWLADKPAGEPVFCVKGKLVNILRPDLAAAREAWLKEARTAAERTEREQSSFLRYVDDAGQVADFHSLRHSFISLLVSGGASVKTCQELARHSNPLLTIGRYSHVRLKDLTGALDGLPCPAPIRPEPERIAATGTYDHTPHTPDNSARQSRRERAGLGDTLRDANPVFGSENAVSELGAKTGPGRGDRGSLPEGVGDTVVTTDAGTPPTIAPDNGPDNPTAEPGLVRVVTAWPELPEAIRRAVLALVDTASPTGGER